jgi:hypothetical protein
MKIILERHAYAPELNKAHIVRKGAIVASLPVPGATSIREARKALFQPRKPGRWACVHSERSAPWHGLNRTIAGMTPLGREGLAQIQLIRRQMHDKGGELLDGWTLPPSSVRIESRLIG